MKQITLKQIAEKANVSIGTVDRALNKRGRINEETKKNILRIAQELGYQPNKIASALSRSQTLRIAVLYPKFPDYFINEFAAGVEKAIEHFTYYKIEVVPYRCNSLDPASQIEVIRTMDFSNIDGFTLNASGDELAPYINDISKNGVPVVTFNSDIYNSSRLFHVGIDSFQAGQICGNLMCRILHGKGKIAAISGFHSTLSHRERILGFLDIASHYPDIEIIQEGEYLDKQPIAQQCTQELLQKYPDINGIYTVSSPGTLGAGDHLRTLPSQSRPLLVGYDISQMIQSQLEEDVCTFVLYQNPAAQIYYAIVYLVEYLMFNKLPKQEMNFLPAQIVVKENIEYYLHRKDQFTFVE